MLDKVFSSEEIFLCSLNLKIVSGVLVLGLAWYYLFWKPFDWYRDFTDFGFHQVKQAHDGYGDHTKKSAINEVRQRRCMGDLPPSYPNGWFVIVESDQLKRQEAKEVSALGLNLVAWRGESGKAYVADAYCPHLGAHLGIGGKVRKECITCPFHGWQFEGSNGHLFTIPYSKSKPEFAKINMRTIVERNGFIYLWFHADGDEPYWYPDVVEEIDSGEWIYRGRSEFRVACHIQEIPENGADINHLKIVHESALMTGATPENALFSWGGVKHGWSGEWKPCDEPGKKHMAILNVSHCVKLFDILAIIKVDIQAVQFGPGIVHLEFNTSMGRVVLFHMVTPLGPLLQKITHRLYSPRSFIQPLASMVLLGESVMIARDISIWNRKTFVKNPVLPKEDSTIKKYRTWYSQFYTDNSPRSYFKINEDILVDF